MLILLAAVMIIVGMLILIYTSRFRDSGEKGIKITTNSKEEFLRFDEFIRLNKTSFFISNLSSSQTKFGSFSSYDYNNLKNVLLFDFKSQKGQWIFKDNNTYVVNNHNYIHEDEKNDCCDRSESLKSKTIGIIFTYADIDTNNDGKIDRNDKLNLIHHNLQKNKSTKILLDADSLLGIKKISKNEMIIFYTQNFKSYFRKYDLESYQISGASMF